MKTIVLDIPQLYSHRFPGSSDRLSSYGLRDRTAGQRRHVGIPARGKPCFVGWKAEDGWVTVCHIQAVCWQWRDEQKLGYEECTWMDRRADQWELHELDKKTLGRTILGRARAKKIYKELNKTIVLKGGSQINLNTAYLNMTTDLLHSRAKL